MVKRLGVLGAAIAVLVATSPLPAQTDEGTKSAARSLGNAGVEAYQAGNFEVAAAKLDKAYQVLRVPSLGLWSARAFAKIGRLLQASERYREVTTLVISEGQVDVQKQAQLDAASELEAILPRIPSVVVKLEGAPASDVSLTLDGAPLASALVGETLPVNPGKHRAEGQRLSEKVSTEVSVKEGEQKIAVLRFAPASVLVAGSSAVPAAVPAAPTDDRGGGSLTRTMGWVALGAGGVGLAVGAVTGIMALGERRDIDESPNCDENVCAPSEQDAADRLNSLRTISTVGFIAGGALAGTGLVLILTSGTSKEPSASAFIGPLSAGVRGRF